jgi:hypothetical protein
MLRDKTVFTDNLLDSFCVLQADSIVNVRLELSLCLKETAETYGEIPKIQQAVSRLKFDSNRDITMAVKGLKGSQEERSNESSSADAEQTARAMLQSVYEDCI